MSYKLALILSVPFLMMMFLFMGDLMNISILKSHLDSLAVTISYRISYEGRLSDGTKELASSTGVNVNVQGDETPKIGDTVIFVLEKEYQPLIMVNGPMTLRLTRSAVVGYYDK